MLEREKDVGIIISYYNKEIDAWNLYIYYSTKFVIFRVSFSCLFEYVVMRKN